jgi:hypothetical protein
MTHLLDQVIHEYPDLWRRKPRGLKQQMHRCGWRLTVDQNAAQPPGSKIGFDLPGRDPDDSGALLGRRNKSVQAVDPEPTRYSDFAFPFYLFIEAPLADPRGIGKYQAVVSAKISG